MGVDIKILNASLYIDKQYYGIDETNNKHIRERTM